MTDTTDDRETAPLPKEAQAAPMDAVPARPPIRWGGVLWGALFAVVAVALLVVLLDPDRRDMASAWVDGLTSGALWFWVVLVAGVLLFVAGFSGLLRRRGS